MIENFMNSPGAGILVCVGAVLMIYTLIVIVLKAYYAALTSAIVDFYLFYDGHVDMQICALLRCSQCRVSGTQVTIKVHGPLSFI